MTEHNRDGIRVEQGMGGGFKAGSCRSPGMACPSCVCFVNTYPDTVNIARTLQAEDIPPS